MDTERPAERADSRPRDSPDDDRVEKRPRREFPESNGDAASHPPPHSSSAPDFQANSTGSDSQDRGYKQAKILLANLPYDVSELQVENFFKRQRLHIDGVKLLGINTEKKQCNGNAFVYLNDERYVPDAVRLDYGELNGRTIRIYDFKNQKTACVRCSRPSATKDDIEALFEGFELEAVRSAPPRNDYHPPSNTTTWFVDFVQESAFEVALSTDRSKDGMVVCVATPSSRARNREGYGRRDDRRGPNRSPPYGRGPRSGGGPGDYDRYDRRDQDRRPPYDYRDGDRHGGGRFDRRGPDRRDERGPDLGRGNSRDGMEPGRSRDRFRDQPYDQDRRRSFDGNRDRRDPGPYRPRDMDYQRNDRGGPRDHDRFNPRSRDDNRREGGRGGSPGGGGFSRSEDMDDQPYRRGGRDGDRRFNDRDRFQNNRDWDGDGRNDRFRNNRDRDDYRPRNRDRYQRDDDRPRPKNNYDQRQGGTGRPDFITGLIDSAINEANRFCGDIDEDLTIVISSLPFQDDRGYMSEQIRLAFTSVHPSIKIKYIFPAGRRCGHCFVVFEDVRSREMALGMQKVSVFDRPANVHPLEKPYLVRFHKLLGSSTPDQVSEDLRKDFEIEGVRAAPDFGEFCFFRIAETKDFVRLLAVDGFPYQHGRLVSVSYYQGKRPFSAGGQQRRNNRDYDDDRRDRNGDYGGRGGDYRGGGGGGGGGGGPPSRSNDDGNGGGGGHDRGFNDSGSARHHSWNVRLEGLPEDTTQEQVLQFLSDKGIEDVHVKLLSKEEVARLLKDKVSDKRIKEEDLKQLSKCVIAEVDGRNNRFSALKKTLMLNSATFRKGATNRVLAEEISPRRNEPPADTTEDGDASREVSKMNIGHKLVVDPSKSGGIKRASPRNEKDEDERPSKKQALEARNEVMNISPVSPPTDNENDWKMPAITARFARVKNVIVNGLEFEDELPYDSFFDTFKEIDGGIKDYESKYGDVDNDIDIPVVWKGGLRFNGGHQAKANAYLVHRRSYSSEEVKRATDLFLDDFHIERGIRPIDPAFSHAVHEHAVVFFIRADQDELDELMRMSPGEKPAVTSRSVVLGTNQYLESRGKYGLVRFDKDNSKYGALFLAPTDQNFEKLKIPWRFRELIAHDSVLMVIGKKATAESVRKIVRARRTLQTNNVNGASQPTPNPVGVGTGNAMAAGAS